MGCRIIFLLGLILLCSCLKQQESIKPLAPATTLANLERESLMRRAMEAGNSDVSEEALATLEMSPDPALYFLHIKINLNDIDVFKTAGMPNTFEELGHSFLRTAAKFVLAVMGPQTININDIDLNVPDFNVDRSIVHSLQIKKIFLTYNKVVDEQSDYAADFSFVDTLELSREVNVANVGKVNTLFLSYRKARNFCMYKCIQFEVLEDNLLDILKPNTDVKLKPALKVGKLPAINDLRLDGVIDLKIGLKLPF